MHGNAAPQTHEEEAEQGEVTTPVSIHQTRTVATSEPHVPVRAGCAAEKTTFLENTPPSSGQVSVLESGRSAAAEPNGQEAIPTRGAHPRESSSKQELRSTCYPCRMSDNRDASLPLEEDYFSPGTKASPIAYPQKKAPPLPKMRPTTAMNFLARVLLWWSVAATIGGVVWYSRELRLNGTDPHLIAWFSAGNFVLLGFPISIYGIFMHLSNYYQPNVQCYVVRILWMVPIYSIESWLCLRFHTLAIYIETLRDCYESFVLYSFLQFLIEVLGGEEALATTLKDKSPTKGHHIWGMQWCVRPWLMGQPVARITSYESLPTSSPSAVEGNGEAGGGFEVGVGGGSGGGSTSAIAASGGSGGGGVGVVAPSSSAAVGQPVKRVRWTSPFLIWCKYGVLQYVVLKFVCATVSLILEMLGLYKEGNFTYRGGYLYVCFLTNLSQCWALYCLVFFYNATKNELGPIRPMGKFLSVEALLFATWWQSVGISMLFQMGVVQDGSGSADWTPEDVAKGLQGYLICIEMFIGTIVHMFVFPHTDYLQPIGDHEEHCVAGSGGVPGRLQ